MPDRLTRLLAALAAAIATIGLTVAITTDGNGGRTITIRAGAAAPTSVLQGPTGPTKIVLSKGEQQTVHNQITGDGEQSLRDTTAPSAEQLKLNNAQASPKLRGPPAGVDQILNGASPYQPGCKTAIVANRSSRGSARPSLFVFHWTASQPGSGAAIVAYFNRPEAQASSTWVTDRAGACWLTVPVAEKPWTQIAFNSWAVSVEVANPGVTTYPFGIFTDRASYDKAVQLARYAHHVLGIPYQRAQVTCSPYARVIQPGFIDHVSLGPCGGGHPDVGDYDYMKVVADAQRLDSGPKITKADRRKCRAIRAYRDTPASKRRPRGADRQKARVRFLHGHGLTCAHGRPKQRAG